MGVVTEAARNRLADGTMAFNRGEYFQAHELWEEAWRELDGVERTSAQGLIQIAAGLHHLQQRRPRPAAELLRKGIAKLSPGMSPPPLDIHVDALVRSVDRLLASLGTSGTEVPDPAMFDLRL